VELEIVRQIHEAKAGFGEQGLQQPAPDRDEITVLAQIRVDPQKVRTTIDDGIVGVLVTATPPGNSKLRSLTKPDAVG
jgi:hypothetical protein